MPRLTLTPSARHALARLGRGDRRQAARVHAALAQLRKGAEPPSARRLTGDRTGQKRASVGKLRVIYERAGGSVRILTIDYRSRAYGSGSGRN